MVSFNTKRFSLAVASLLLATPLVLSGCSTTSGPATVKTDQAGVAVESGSQKYIKVLKCTQNSNIRVAIGSITCKAAACKQSGAKEHSGLFQLLQLAGVPSFEGIGDGMQDMFTSALQQTGCFRVISKEAIKNMQAFGVQTKLKKPQYIVMGAVTSISFSKKSSNFGGGFLPIIGSVGQTKQEASLTMDVQLIDTKTGEIVFSKTYSAKSNKTSYGVGGAGYGSGIGFGGALSGLSGTAMEKVVRDIIVKASYDIAQKVVPADLIQFQTIPVKK